MRSSNALVAGILADGEAASKMPIVHMGQLLTEHRLRSVPLSVPLSLGLRMTPHELLRKLDGFREHQPLTVDLERRLRRRRPNSRPVWYQNQKEHWQGWLRDYCGPGAYGRRDWNRSAEFVYNHIVSPWRGARDVLSNARIKFNKPLSDGRGVRDAVTNAPLGRFTRIAPTS